MPRLTPKTGKLGHYPHRAVARYSQSAFEHHRHRRSPSDTKSYVWSLYAAPELVVRVGGGGAGSRRSARCS